MNTATLLSKSVNLVKPRSALISVWDKTGLRDLLSTLVGLDIQIISTGGTAKEIKRLGYSDVREISDLTQCPEILGGRVKSLQYKIHAGILARREDLNDTTDIQAHGIEFIDLVVVNLYPFQETGETHEECIEKIDIGGPALLRAAAKNYQHVAVLSSPDQYAALTQQLKTYCGETTLEFRHKLAGRAFAATANYDASIAHYLASSTEVHLPFETSITKQPDTSMELQSLASDFPITNRVYQPQTTLKYGCNPHQSPAWLCSHLDHPKDVPKVPFKVLNGQMGYINVLDALNGWQLVRELKEASGGYPAAASMKHCSPAGAAIAAEPFTSEEAQAYGPIAGQPLMPAVSDEAYQPRLVDAYVRARNADPMSSFGDFCAVSEVVDIDLARYLKQEVCDGIIAPGYHPEALDLLRSKKNGFFLILQADADYEPPEMEFRELFGLGMAQRRNEARISPALFQNLVTATATETAIPQILPQGIIRDLMVATVALKYTQSNSVVYAKHGQTIGVGAGQQSRVDCIKLAGRKASLWWLRQHPKVLDLPLKPQMKKQDKITTRIRYIEGDLTTQEQAVWPSHFDSRMETQVLSEREKEVFLDKLHGVVLSSDAFFPFRDSVDHASKCGVDVIAQPGGSVQDAQVIRACEEYGIKMAFTNLRLFYH